MNSLFWTQFLGALNDNVFKNAFVMLLIYKGLKIEGLPTEQVVALTGGVFILPFFLFSALAGELADKYEKAWLVRFTKITEILVMLLGTIGFFMHNAWILMIALFLMGAQSTFFGPMKYSMIPDLVSEDELVNANAKVETGTFVATLIGTVAGGLLANLEFHVLSISASVLGIAVLGYVTSLGIPPVPIGNPHLKIHSNPIPTLTENFQLVRKNEGIFHSILGTSWFWFFGTGVLSVLPIYCKEVLSGSATVTTFFLGLFTLGVGLGNVICAKLTHKKVNLSLVAIGAVGISIFVGDLYFANPLSQTDLIGVGQFLNDIHGVRISFDFFMMSVFGGIFILPLYTLLQERSDRNVRSRIIAGNNIMNAALMVLGTGFLMGLYALSLTPQEIFLVFSILNLTFAFYLFLKSASFQNDLRRSLRL